MKKVLAIILALVLVLGLAACGGTSGGNNAANTNDTNTNDTNNTNNAEPTTTGGSYKLGVGHAFETSAKDPTADEDGQFEGDSYVVALLIDEDGKIADAYIDIAQCRLNYTDKGEVLEADKAFKTKRELGDDYGMQKASSLEKGEWYQQADALEEWVIGKTEAEVKAMSVDADGYPTDADLLAGCTMGHMPVFIEAISNAFANTVDAGEDAKTVGVGVVTNATNSKDETTDEDGQIQFYSYFGYSAVDGSGKIVACVIDSVQITATISEGKATAPSEVKTKNELKEDYGMQKASSLEKGEWYQQAEFLANYLVGKTKSEILGIKFDDDDKATDADLLAGCTMGHLSDIVAAVAAGIN